MNKYRITAKLTGNTDDNFSAEVEADNEDEAWAIAYKSQLPRGIYNGKVEELPTREEQAATISRLREALGKLEFIHFAYHMTMEKRCPVCGSPEGDKEHSYDKDCWLAAALKGGE